MLLNGTDLLVVNSGVSSDRRYVTVKLVLTWESPSQIYKPIKQPTVGIEAFPRLYLDQILTQDMGVFLEHPKLIPLKGVKVEHQIHQFVFGCKILISSIFVAHC